MHDALTISGFLILSLFAGFGFVEFYVRRRIQAAVDVQFAKKLEDHKHTLSLLAETAKSDLQKHLEEFNLFASRKHAAAAEVHRALRVAHGRVVGLLGLAQAPTFEDYDKDDVVNYVSKKGFTELKKREVLDAWDDNRAAAINELYSYSRIIDIGEARRHLAEATNAYLLNELYFSSPTVERLRNLVSCLRDFLYAVENPPIKTQTLSEQGYRRPSHEDADGAMASVTEALQKEIRSIRTAA